MEINPGDVVSGSKILRLKAIHNSPAIQCRQGSDVVSGSKILRLKAIHNCTRSLDLSGVDVVSGSKILRLKAIIIGNVVVRHK